MQIVYKPFIDHTALIVSVEDDLDGTVKLHMTVKGKPALITMSVAEAALLFWCRAGGWPGPRRPGCDQEEAETGGSG